METHSVGISNATRTFIGINRSTRNVLCHFRRCVTENSPRIARHASMSHIHDFRIWWKQKLHFRRWDAGNENSNKCHWHLEAQSPDVVLVAVWQCTAVWWESVFLNIPKEWRWWDAWRLSGKTAEIYFDPFVHSYLVGQISTMIKIIIKSGTAAHTAKK